jgi:transmembrane sensor
MTPDRPDPLPDTPGPIDWEALARYLAGESSPAEVEQVRAWLAAHPSDAALLESLDGHLDRLAAPDTTAPGPDVEAALREVNARRDGAKVLPLRDGRAPVASPLRGTRFIAPRTPPGERPVAEGSAWRGPALRAAALVAIVAGGYAAVRALDREEGTTPPATVAATMLATATGERDSVRLGDGTLVVLGPESRLEVAAGFGDDRRDVTLVGDGYFEVQHDDARPFTVHAAGASVRDIGTVFTVRARGDAPVTVIVTRGAVLLRAADRGKAEGVVLHERDRGTLAPGGSPHVERGVATEPDLAWRSGRLAFREATMADVREEFRRWYGVELQLVDSALASRRFTGDLGTASVERALDVLRIALGVDMERDGRTVRVRTGMGGGTR